MRHFFLIFVLLGVSWAQNTARMLSGVNYQTGVSYTFATTDTTKLVSFSNGSAIAATLPSPITLGLSPGPMFSAVNIGSGTVTITCSGCTINGSTTLQLLNGQGADIYNDGTNYGAVITAVGSATLPSGTLGQPLINANGSTSYVTTPLFWDVFTFSGATADVKFNNANAYAITTGHGVVDASDLDGSQTIASEVIIGQLLPPVVSNGTSGSLSSGTFYVSYSLTSPQIAETTTSHETVYTTSGCTTNCSLIINAPIYLGTATTWAVYVGTARWNMNLCGSVGGTSTGSNITVTASCAGKNVSTIFNNGGTPNVHLIPPKNGTWTVTSAQGAGYCGVMYASLSSNQGESSGEGRSWIIQGSGSTNLDALVCTDPDPEGTGTAAAGYYHIDGISVVAVAGDTYHIAPAVIQFTFDKSKFLDWHVGSHVSGPSLWTYGTCCGTVIEAQVESNYTAGAIPLRVGCIASAGPCANQSGVVTNSTTYLAGSYVHPGNTASCTAAATTCPNIELYAGGNNLNFLGTTYLETQNTTCNDAIQSGTGGQAGGPFNFDQVQIGAGVAGCFIFNMAVTNSLTSLRIGQIKNGAYLHAVKVSGLERTPTLTSNTSFPGYIYDANNAPIFDTGIRGFVLPIANVPSCTANFEGSMGTATTCNAACSAGGTCTTGGSTHCQIYCNSTPAWVETGR